ncbi:MAG TPA: hypothetical protein VFZ93_05170 [Albitalea sp.]
MQKARVFAIVAIALATSGCALWKDRPARPAGELARLAIPAGVNVAIARESNASPEEHAILVYQDGKLIRTVKLPNVIGPQQCLGTAKTARTVELAGWNVAKQEMRPLKLRAMGDGRYSEARVLEPTPVFEQVAVSALVAVPSQPSEACALP